MRTRSVSALVYAASKMHERFRFEDDLTTRNIDGVAHTRFSLVVFVMKRKLAISVVDTRGT